MKAERGNCQAGTGQRHRPVACYFQPLRLKTKHRCTEIAVHRRTAFVSKKKLQKLSKTIILATQFESLNYLRAWRHYTENELSHHAGNRQHNRNGLGLTHMFKNTVVGILSFAVFVTVQAAQPKIYIQFTNGTSDFARRFISTNPGDEYGLTVITKVVNAGPPKYKLEERTVKFSEMKSLDRIEADEPHIHPELDWLYSGSRSVFHVVLSDGSKMESSGTTLFHYAGGLAFAVGTGLAKSAPIDSTLRYEDANGATILVRDTGIKRIIFDDPARVAVEIKKAQLQKGEQARQQQVGWALVENFRAKIKAGSETNCGPVLEKKGSLVKVYAPVKDYGNEHWIRVTETFPPSYSCNFMNGRYTPPQLQ